MGYLKKSRDAKIQNGRYDRQERLDRVDEILANQDPPCVHSNVCNEKECPCEEYEEDSDYYFDDEREEELSLDIVTGDIVLTPKENQEDLGACGSYGERLYDEGTELCDCCELSETCFAFYKRWSEEKL